jgi:hypothetical protein
MKPGGFDFGEDAVAEFTGNAGNDVARCVALEGNGGEKCLIAGAGAVLPGAGMGSGSDIAKVLSILDISQ